jgi:hypothetical protein
MKKYLLFTLLLPFTGQSQNSCAGAVAITPGTYTTGAIDGTNVTGNTVCWGGTSQIGQHAEWYSYTPAADGIARIKTNFPANDGITLSNNIHAGVHTGTCGSLSCIGADGLISGSAPYYADITFEAREGTTYYISFDDYYSNKGLQFELILTTPTCDNTIPFSETWGTQLGFTCWKTYGGVGTQKWTYHPYMNLDADPQYDPVAVSYPSNNVATPKNQWLVSPPLQLEAGTNYSVSVKYNALHFGGTGATPNESFRTVVLSQQDPALAAETELGQVDGIVQQGAYVPPYNSELATTVTYNYMPPATGNYYLGLHSISPATVGALVIYDVTVAQAPLSAGEFESEKFRIYPNPANNLVHIDNQDIAINSISITDMNGRIVAGNYNKDNGTVDVSALAQGMYVMSIAYDGGVYNKKIVKQ